MMRREFLMLAQSSKTVEVPPGIWLASEKLNGMRAIWDGGITRGMDADKVWFANNLRERRLEPPKATGLWSRHGKVIQAPDWFLDLLPNFPLDGELYDPKATFEGIVSDVKIGRFQNLSYYIFDAPSYKSWLGTTGLIKTPTFNLFLDGKNCPKEDSPQSFLAAHNKLLNHGFRDPLVLLPQILVNNSTLKTFFNSILKADGEGVMLRNAHSIWMPFRSNDLLKIKRHADAEGVIVGFKAGDGKYAGKIGALIIKFGNVLFDLSGITDDQREIICSCNYPPGAIMEGRAKHFAIGEVVTFRYQQLSAAGVPIHARFLQKRLDNSL